MSKINSKNIFTELRNTDAILNSREAKISLRESRLNDLKNQQNNNIDPDVFFQQGVQQGFESGRQAGFQEAQQAAASEENKRSKGGPIVKGETYLVGEKGPEYITPKQNAFVVSNEELNSIPTPLNTSRVRIQPIIQTVKKIVETPFPVPTPFSVPTPSPVLFVEGQSSSIARKIV